MVIAFIISLIFTLTYVPIGQQIADRFDMAGNTFYILAWPAVLVWLLCTILPETVTDIVELAQDRKEDNVKDVDDEVDEYALSLRRGRNR